MKQTPKEKAEELIYRFSTPIKVFDELQGWLIHLDSSKAKGHALTAVNELIKSHYLLTTTHDLEPSIRCKSYWKEVKKQIENL